MKRFLFLISTHLLLSSTVGQTLDNVVLRGSYSPADSLQLLEAYSKAFLAVQRMHEGIDAIWEVKGKDAKSRKELRSEKWREDAAFMEWLGQPGRIAQVRRRIAKIHSKFEKKLILEVKKENKGRCTGWISAWTIPFGKVKIRLCEDFFIYRTHLQEKVLVHEMGHEVGLLFHRKIHGCRAARRAANLTDSSIAKKSPENYAWLAVSFLGISCSPR